MLGERVPGSDTSSAAPVFLAWQKSPCACPLQTVSVCPGLTWVTLAQLPPALYLTGDSQ